jgi:mRNA deadenylase 3'-5' endonuclease subunit Ccr4
MDVSAALPLTTCTPSFRGAIDHIWHSDDLVPASVLSLPYSGMGETFESIPDAHFSSDHIAIGACYRFR